MITRALWTAVAAAMMAMGCSKQPDPPKKPSTAQKVVDQATGRAAVRSYLDTKDTLRDIGEKQKDYHDKVPKTP